MKSKKSSGHVENLGRMGSIWEDLDERGGEGEAYRKSSVKPTEGTWSSLAASTAVCSGELLSPPEVPKSLTESEDFLVGKPSMGFSSTELIVRWDGRMNGWVKAS
jgi:hypothetical protein